MSIEVILAIAISTLTGVGVIATLLKKHIKEAAVAQGPEAGLNTPASAGAIVAGNMQQWEFAAADLDWANAREIGRGGFGVVFDIACGGLRVAAKRMDVSIGRQREDLERLLRREFRALHRVVHDNIIRVFGVVVDEPSYVCLLIELASSGSLRALLDTSPAVVCSNIVTQLNLARDMARGMGHLHGLAPPMIHHDFKSDNVLLFPSSGDGGGFNAKVSDFGLATGIGGTTLGATKTYAGGGSLAYKSPEAFESDNKFSAASDVYAFGIVCWELLTGERPWGGHSEAALLGAVMRGERPALPASSSATPRHGMPALNVPKLIASKAQHCWHQEASSRPTFAQISQQLEYSATQLETEKLGCRKSLHDADERPADVFISFRFGEAHTEALALKTALEQRNLKVFLSNVSPGGDLQDVISAALANCRAAVILATKTYGLKTNGLFDTSNEMAHRGGSNSGPSQPLLLLCCCC
jgi:serine/threonine protein kinase